MKCKRESDGRETLAAVHAFLDRLADAYTVTGATLFGSRARGDFQPDSDADVAVRLAGSPNRFVEIKLAMADIAYDVLLETGIRIQPLPVWDEEWAHPDTYSNPRLLENIAREGIAL
jgi:antitoxin ChpS